MSEVTALIAEIKSKGLLRAGDKLEELYVVAAIIQAENLELKAQRNALSVECATLKEFALGLYSPDGTSRVEGEDLPKTPATDAYLNSVRAEGIQMLLNKHAPHTIASSEASEFAAQLRAGETL